MNIAPTVAEINRALLEGSLLLTQSGIPISEPNADRDPQAIQDNLAHEQQGSKRTQASFDWVGQILRFLAIFGFIVLGGLSVLLLIGHFA